MLAVLLRRLPVGNSCTDTCVSVRWVLPPNGISTVEAPIEECDGNDVESGEVSGSVTANVTIDDIQDLPEDETSVIANIILAVYDRSGKLVSMNKMEADLCDVNQVFLSTIDIPDGVSVGSIKLMIWRDLNDMSPLANSMGIYKSK